MYKNFQNPTVVQKYGGTSVGTIERIHAVADRVKAQKHAGYTRIAIVVSAMAGETNRLIDLVNQVNPRAHPRLSDFAVSAGEQVSVALLAAAIEQRGLMTCPLLGFQLGIVTDSLYSQARVKQINTKRILNAWENGQIPVIAGFQGITPAGEITTLGRGGGDTSAVAVAVALNADFCEINTDVDGFYTADPRVINEAKLVDKMDYNVALEMAALGSKVLHSRCVELAAKYKMPLTVRNSFKSEDNQRTKIMSFSDREAIEAPVVSGVSVDRNVARLAISNVEKDSSFITELFEQIAESSINVDIIVHNRREDEAGMRLAFTCAETDLIKAKDVISRLKSKSGYEKISLESESGLAKVSVVGLGMQAHHGVAAKSFSALTRNGIDIRMISTSEIKISCVVEKGLAEKAAKQLHKEFIE